MCKYLGKPAWTGAEEHGCIDLTNKIKNVKISGSQGLVFVGKDTDMPIFEVISFYISSRYRYIYIYIYIYMYVCIYIFKYIYMYVNIYIYI
jgi:hypothetical protein